MSKDVGRLAEPVALGSRHDLSTFDCGREPITLQARARDAIEADTARVYAVCRGARKVVAFYALAAGGVARSDAPGALRRNSPDPIPVIILAVLGVDKPEQEQGLGRDLLSDAMRRALQASKIIGARALLVHAIDARTSNFYRQHGFSRFGGEAEALFLPMKAIRQLL